MRQNCLPTYAVILLVLKMGALGFPASAVAGAWTLSQGQFWGKVTYFKQHADEWYISGPTFIGREISAGTRQPYRFNGEYDSQALFIEAFVGITDRLDLGVKVPYFDQEFVDDVHPDLLNDRGFSDLRLFAKFQTIQVPAIVTVKTGVKIPTAAFRNEDGLIPVGEGQWDFDFLVQVGRSFWPLPIYGNVDVGYRVRTENEEIVRDPGDEWLINAEVGYNITPRIQLVTKFEMLRGKAGKDFGFRSRTQIRCVTFLVPTVVISLSRNTNLEIAARQSLNGRNFPAGRQLTLGVAISLGLIRR